MSKQVFYILRNVDMCINCGADEVLHRANDGACPLGGYEAPAGKTQQWGYTTFCNTGYFEATEADFEAAGYVKRGENKKLIDLINRLSLIISKIEGAIYEM